MIWKSVSKWQIKMILVLSAFIIVLTSVFYTNILVDELVNREKNTLDFYIDIYRRYLEPDANIADLDFLVEKITPTISFPIIFTDKNDNPILTRIDEYSESYKPTTLNIEIDSTLPLDNQKEFLLNKIHKMGNEYLPIIVEDKNGKIITKYYYSHSDLVDKLRLFPIIEITVIFTFVLIGYLAFSNIRRSEESKVWVGMAKEAAHQLGTPISSLLAWLEIMKNSRDNPEFLEETVSEMEKDVSRLEIISRRFSKIGSTPERVPAILDEELEQVCLYFERRLPHLGKKIEIKRKFETGITAPINHELFAWVIENLLKNAAEAIETKSGQVKISLLKTNNQKIIITVADNGKGMSSKQKRQVFNTGFTTKKRGWGLGLTLSKRIVEEYHNGKIYVKESIPGKGTIFQIELATV